MAKDIENLGSIFMSSSSRESLIYQANVFQHHLPDAVDILSDTVRNAAVNDGEIAETKEIILYELQQSFEKPEWLLPELAHQTAYQGDPLGQPQVCIPENLPRITRKTILDYRARFVLPRNIVLAGIGMKHEHLLELAGKYFGDMSPSPAEITNNGSCSAVKARYTGGTHHQPDENLPFLHFFLGFESSSMTDPDLYAFSVLQTMLGGGDSFSAGGPGKGMYSRLYTNVLNQYHWVEKIQASNCSYADTGLFGFHAAVPPIAASKMLDILALELSKILTAPISNEELSRAKNQLRSSVFMNLESKMVHLEDLGRQVQIKGSRTGTGEISASIDRITEEDLKRVTRKMLSSEPTFVMLGNHRAVKAVNLERFNRIIRI
jgi:processing peptidase subunit alpha